MTDWPDSRMWLVTVMPDGESSLMVSTTWWLGKWGVEEGKYSVMGRGLVRIKASTTNTIL